MIITYNFKFPVENLNICYNYVSPVIDIFNNFYYFYEGRKLPLVKDGGFPFDM